MKITDLDIPFGLEELFAKIFRPFIAGSSDVIITKKNPASTRIYKYLNDFSLMVRWQSLYNGFDSIRKIAWSDYWLTLPFGDHSGGNGWPGSGFSAFIYVNAPRIKLNEDLLLDPPFGVNIIVNGTFTDTLDPWQQVDAPWIWDTDRALLPLGLSVGGLHNQIFQDLSLVITEIVTLHCEFDIGGDIGTDGVLLYFGSFEQIPVQVYAADGHYSGNFTLPEDYDFPDFGFVLIFDPTGTDGLITNLFIDNVTLSVV